MVAETVDRFSPSLDLAMFLDRCNRKSNGKQLSRVPCENTVGRDKHCPFRHTVGNSGSHLNMATPRSRIKLLAVRDIRLVGIY